MKNFSSVSQASNTTSININTGNNTVLNRGFNKTNLIEKMNHSQTTKFKSVFDKEGNPFKYFMDIKKHLNSNSNSLL